MMALFWAVSPSIAAAGNDVVRRSAIALIFVQFGSVAGRDAGIALLVMMMGLKLLELRERRDVLVLVFLGYFVLVTHFLYNQGIPMATYVFATAWLLVSLHIHLTHMDAQPIKISLRTAGVLLAQALPLMLVLFVLFPRLPGPIWSLPKDAYEGMSGLDDSMSPGNISRMVLVDNLLILCIGLGLGYISGYLVTDYYAHAGIHFEEAQEIFSRYGLSSGIYPELNSITLLIGPVCIALSVLLAGLFPILRIHRMDAVAAMRSI